MAQTLINFRIDEETKKEMEQVCNELGMTMSTALNIFIKKMTREKRIPFEVSIDPFYSENNIKHLEKITLLKNGKQIMLKLIKKLLKMQNKNLKLILKVMTAAMTKFD